MPWVPQKPASHRRKLLAFTIAAIPIVVLIVFVIVGILGLLALPDLSN